MSTSPGRPIKDYCLGIFDGPHATPRESPDGPIFLGIRNITEDGRLDLSDVRHVSEEDFPRWTRRVTPQANDVVFTYEATLHRYALIGNGFRGCLGRRVALVRPDPSQVDSRYLLYYFLSRSWRAVVESNIISGATVDRIPLERFPYFSAALPSLPVQQRIAEALSAYDELIENNRRRMMLLDAAARHLYTEWFVRLRFPGHEHTPVHSGVPEGWESRPLGRCAKFLSGGTPRKTRSDYWEGDISWVSSGEMTETRLYTARLRITAEAVQEGSRSVPANTILAVVRGMSLAKEFRVAITTRAMAFNQDLKALVCEADVEPEFLFNALLARQEHIRDLATEASHGTKKLETPVLAGIPILLAGLPLQRQFRELASPLNAQRDNLHRQNENLRRARDLLLPRLMGGEIAA